VAKSLNVTFVNGSTTVTLPGPIGGSAMSRIKAQAIGLSAGGTRFAYDKGATDRFEAELAFKNLSTDEKEDLDSFFDSDVDGVTTTFTYTDTNGQEYTARFLEPELRITKVVFGIWDVSMKLELSVMGK